MTSCQSHKWSMIVIYANWREIFSNYDSRVVNYGCGVFMRLPEIGNLPTVSWEKMIPLNFLLFEYF